MGTRITTVGLLQLLTLTSGLLTLATCLPAQQSDSAAPSAMYQQLSAYDQLSQLLERAVQRVLDRRPPAAGQLERVLHRLDVLELRMTALTAGGCDGETTARVETGREARSELVPELGSGSKQEPEPEPEPEQEPESEPTPTPTPTPTPEPEPACEKSPRPLQANQAPYQQPAVLACAESCLQLRDEVASPRDGVYWFTNMPVPTLCDFSHDGGGWTLLLTAPSRDGWNLLSVRGRRERSPSLTDNYSILRHADRIRRLGKGDKFAYRIETQAEKGRQRWGGIWLAPRDYSFLAQNASQTDVLCVRKFDKWLYKNTGIRRRMPWLNMGRHDAGTSAVVLTTTDDPANNGWGSLVYDEGTTSYQHSPWSHPEARNTGKVLYWMREEML